MLRSIKCTIIIIIWLSISAMEDSFVDRWRDASLSDRSGLMDELGFSIGQEPLKGWQLLYMLQSSLKMENFDAACCTRVALVSSYLDLSLNHIVNCSNLSVYICFQKLSPRFSAFAFFLTTFNVNLIIDYLNSLPLHFQSLRPALKLLDEVPSMDDDEAMTVCEQLLQTMIIFVTECMGSVCLNKGPNLIVRITFWATLNHCHYPCY